MLRHTVDEGFMRETYLDMLQVAGDPAALIALLQRFVPTVRDKWTEKRNVV